MIDWKHPIIRYNDNSNSNNAEQQYPAHKKAKFSIMLLATLHYIA